MRFKTPALKAEWETTYIHPVLRAVLILLDVAAKAMGGYILITCIHRPWDKKSFHSKARAADVRIWGWSKYFKACVTRILKWFKKNISPEIQHEWESDHLHIEIDNGTIKRSGDNAKRNNQET